MDPKEETRPNSPASVILAGTAHPFRGGLAFFNQKLVEKFNDRGIRSKIYTFTVQYPEFFFPGKSQYTDDPAPENISIERKINTVNPFNWIRIGRKIEKEKPDILLVRYWLPLMAPCFGTICRIARRNKHTKVLALLDNVIPHEKRPFDTLFTKYFVGGADAFIYMSEDVHADLRKFDTKKPALFSPHPLFDVYGNPVRRPEACRRLGLDERYRYLLFFGYVREYKGLDLLIEAVGVLKRDGKLGDIRLVVAGEYYSDKEKYLALIREKELENEVILFDHFVKDGEVKCFFSAADLVVQPYKTATQSGVTQVAYHFEVPMIVTDVGGLAEIVPDGKVGYVTGTAPEEIARAIERFYGENKTEEFRENIREEKKRFSWDAMTERFIELYTKVDTP